MSRNTARYPHFFLTWLVVLFCLCGGAVTAWGQSVDQAIDNAEAWLLLQQEADGSFGNKLAPRDTAAVVQALVGRPLSEAALAQGVVYLQGVPEANTQYRAGRILALALAGEDPSPLLATLGELKNGGGMGAFERHESNLLDTALAIQALSLDEGGYLLDVAALVDYLQLHQGTDGGWGFADGQPSDTWYSSEALQGLAQLKQLSVGESVLLNAGAYMAGHQQGDGSFGDIFTTAVAYRSLLAVGAVETDLPFGSPLAYLLGEQQPDGSWQGDVFTTAQVIRVLRLQQPDLLLDSLVLDPDSVIPGEPVTVTATIKNGGPVTAPESTLAFRLGAADAGDEETRAIPELTSGQSFEAQFTLDTSSFTGSSVEIFAVGDSELVVDELTEDNNSSSARLTLRSGPNLALFASDLALSVDPPAPGESFELRITARNLGETAVDSFAYRVDRVPAGAPAELLGSGSSGTLEPGGSVLISLPLSFDEGEHTVEVVLDPDNTVDEENEDDNRMSLTFFVVDPSRADLALDTADLVLNPALPDTPGTVQVDVSVKNLGSRDASADLVIYQNDPSDGGVVLARQSVDVAGGADTPLSLSVDLTAEAHSLTLVIDPENTVEELDESNNRLRRMFRDLPDLAVGYDNFLINGEPAAGSPALGDPVNLSLTVRNAGTLDATSVDVEIWDGDPAAGGVLIHSETLASIPSAGNRGISVPWTATGGLHRLVAVVDPLDTVVELAESNNRDDKELAVDRATGADLRIVAIDRSALSTDAAAASMLGTVSVDVANEGDTDVAEAFEVRLFEDRDGDARRDVGEPVLASQVISSGVAAGSSVTTSLSVDAVVLFHHAPLWLEVDAADVIAEQREGNNRENLFGDCRLPAPTPSGQWQDPVLEWSVPGLEVETAPVVAQLSDDNGDGRVDSRDTPDVVFHTIDSRGHAIKALSGLDGSEVWTFRSTAANPLVGQLGQVAAADLDGDGKVEVVGHQRNGRLIALEHDGTLKWVSDPVEGVGNRGLGGPSVGDLNGDGVPEIVLGRSVVSNNGRLIALGTGNRGQNRNYYGPFGVVLVPGAGSYAHSVIADVDLDGINEIVAGDTLYRLNGNSLDIVWNNTVPDRLMDDGFSAVANLDGDPQAEIVYVSSDQIMILEHTGAVKRGRRVMVPFAPFAFPTYWGGPPTIVDLNGGNPEILVSTATELIAYTSGLSKLWKFNIDNDFGGITGVTAFDLDGDGEREVIFADETKLYVLEGNSGRLLYSRVNTSKTGTEYPVVADVDGDGRAELLLGSNRRGNNTSTQGLHVLGHADWRGTRGIWNQYGYNITNVLLDGTVPSPQTMPWQVAENSFRSAQELDAPPFDLANLTLSRPRVAAAIDAGVPVTLRVGNGGLGHAPAGLLVELIEPGTGAVAGSLRLERGLRPGGFVDVEVIWQLAAAAGAPVRARVDGDNAIDECDESDNTVDFQLQESILGDLEIAAGGVNALGDATVGRLVPVRVTVSNVGAAGVGAFSIQLFEGDPSTGVVAGEAVVAEGLAAAATVEVDVPWDTLAATPGVYSLYAVADPLNNLEELDESNNSGLTQVDLQLPALPDLHVTALSIEPGDAVAGQSVTLTASLLNRGADLVGGFDISFRVNGGERGRASSLADLAAGEARLVQFSLDTTTLAGPVTVTAVADPDDNVQESDEGNNRASGPLTVGGALLDLGVSTDRVGYAADQDVLITLAVENGGDAVSSELNARILDPFGVEMAVLSSGTVELAAGSSSLDFIWNTGSTPAGTYSVWVTAQSAGVQAQATSLFAIAADSEADARLYADRGVYTPLQTVLLTGSISHRGSNKPFDNLSVRLDVSDGSGAEVFLDESTISQLLPGATRLLSAQWPIENRPAGVYMARLQVRDPLGLLVAYAETSLTVENSADTGAGLSGELLVTPETVGAGEPLSALADVFNNGNNDLPALALRLVLRRVDDGESVLTLRRTVSLPRGGSAQESFGLPTAGLLEGPYLVSLVAELPAGDRRLGSQGVTVARGVSVSNVSLFEGDSGTSEARFRLILSSPTLETITASYLTADGTAVAGDDYQAASGSVTFAPGDLEKEVAVTVFGDVIPEAAETFLLTLTSVDGARIGDGQGLATLIDEEGCPGPELLVNGGAENDALEGWTEAESSGWQRRFADPVPLAGEAYFAYAGASLAELQQEVDLSAYGARIDGGGQVFSVSGFVRSQAAPIPATARLLVDYLDVDGNVLAGFDSGLLTTGDGWQVVTTEGAAPVASRSLRLRLVADGSADGNGIYFDQLSVRSLGVPVLTVSGPDQGESRYFEGDDGTSAVALSLHLSCPAAETLLVSYATSDEPSLVDAAEAGVDYSPATGDVTLSVGDSVVELPIELLGDRLDELDERFFVDLSSTGDLVVLDSRATITVLDDDGPVSMSTTDQTVDENAGHVDFPVTLSSISGRTVRVDYAVVGESATAGADFEAASGTLVFDPGVDTLNVSVTVLDDQLGELDETFRLQLSNAQNADLDQAVGTATIREDDEVLISVAGSVVLEGDTPPVNAPFIVSLSIPSALDVTVQYATADLDALAGEDYTAVAGELVIPAGSTEATIDVAVIPDTVKEANEQFRLVLSDAVHGTLSLPEAAATLFDDDGILVSVDDKVVFENDGNAQVVLRLNKPAAVPVTFTASAVQRGTEPGDAVDGSDFTAKVEEVTIAAGTAQINWPVALINDTVGELEQSFDVVLSAPKGEAILLDDQATVRLLDDDLWHLNSQATIRPVPGCVRLTSPTSARQKTSAWRKQKISLTENFDKSMVIYSGATNRGIDGQVFVLQNQGPTARYGGWHGYGEDLRPSIGVEFDPNDNRHQGKADIPQDHVAIHINGGMGSSGLASPPVPAIPDGSDVALGQEHELRVVWNAETQQLDSFFDGVQRVMYESDLVNSIFSGVDEVFYGMTGGSWTPATEHYFCEPDICVEGAQSVLSVGYAYVLEGDSGTAMASFPVTLSCPSDEPVTAEWSTYDLGASSDDGFAVEGEDYPFSSGTVTVPAGQTSAWIHVPVYGDLKDEKDERFGLRLTQVSGPARHIEAQGTIQTDDVIWHTNGTADDSVIPGCVRLTPDGQWQAGSAWRSQKIDLNRHFDMTFDVYAGVRDGGADGLVFSLQNQGDTALGTNGPGMGWRNITPSVGIELDTFYNSAYDRLRADHLAINTNGNISSGRAGSVQASPTSGNVENGKRHRMRVVWNADTQEFDVHFEGSERIYQRLDAINDVFGGDSEVYWGFTGGNGARNEHYFCPTAQCFGSEPNPLVSIGDVKIQEGEAGTVQALFPVTLSCPGENVVTVAFNTVDDTAVAGEDYVAQSGTLTFQPGETHKTIAIDVVADALVEPTETFFVDLSSPSNGQVRYNRGTATVITDDVGVTMRQVLYPEPSQRRRTYRTVVELSSPLPTALTVSYATSDGTATAGQDYETATGSITFAAGETAKSFLLHLLPDTEVEADETFFIDLSGPAGGPIEDLRQTLAMIEVADCPSKDLMINGSAEEPPVEGLFPGWQEIAGDQWTQRSDHFTPFDGESFFYSGVVDLGELRQDVDLSGFAALIDEGVQRFSFSAAVRSLQQSPSDQTRIVVELLDADGDILETYDSLAYATTTYWQTMSHVTTAPVGTRTWRVRLLPDRFVGGQNNAYFDDITLVALSSPSLSVDDVIKVEGEAGVSTAPVTVRLSCPVDFPVAVDYLTQDGSAEAGTDYQPVSGNLVIPGGEVSRVVEVPVNGDTLPEGDETFSLVLTNAVNGAIADDRGEITISQDEVMVTIDSVTVAEGDSGTTDATFTVSLTGPSTLPIMVDYRTTNGSATGGDTVAEVGVDYVETTGMITFLPGETAKPLVVKVLGDQEVENDEIFKVDLSNVINASFLENRGQGLILSDDISVSIADGRLTEGNGGSSPMTFEITLGGPSSQAVSVDWSTRDGSATAGVDYQSASATATFAVGDTSKTISVQVLGDTDQEGGETFHVDLSNPQGIFLDDPEATGFIGDDDDCPSPNLLTNGSNDQRLVDGEIAGWTEVAGSNWRQRSSSPSPLEGSAYFYPQQAGIAELIQDVDVTTYAGYIDSGLQRFAFQGYTRSFNQNPGDTARIVVEYRDQAGTVLSFFDTGETLSKTNWLRHSDQRLAPPGTRTIRVRLMSVRNTPSGNNDGYFDALSLRSLGTPALLFEEDVQIAEGDEGTRIVGLPVTLSCAAAERTIEVSYELVDGTALAGEDFVADSGRLTFAPGETSKQIDLEIIGDYKNELAETFEVRFSDEVNGALNTTEAKVTIRDADPGAPPQPGVFSVYTLDHELDTGVMVKVNHDSPNNDQLQLDEEGSTFPFIWVAATARGTIVKIDTRTGEVLGEYSTNPDNRGHSSPSRTTVALDGSVWVGNRNNRGSVAHIGLPELNQCIDRNGNGFIDTSVGYGDVLAWPNNSGVDSNGGVETAEDECILHFVRVKATQVRHLSVDADNNLWVSGRFGSFDQTFQKIDGRSGEILHTQRHNCGGYGGFVDRNNVLWSASRDASVLRWDIDANQARCISGVQAYGLAVDADGFVFVSDSNDNRIWKITPDGNTVQRFTSTHNGAQGIAIDRNGDLWLSSRFDQNNRYIGHMRNDGTRVGRVANVPGGSSGVAVDAAGKIWTANALTSTVARIDPTKGPLGSDGVTPLGEVDLVIELEDSKPYNYSDMTGFVALQSTVPQGTFAVIQDSGIDGAEWGNVSWNTEPEAFVPEGGSITVEARAADTVIGLGAEQWIEVENAVSFQIYGRFLQVRATLRATPEGVSPVLSDLRIGVIDDALVSIGDATEVEGDAGDGRQLTFPITFEESTVLDTTFDYTVIAGTAGEGEDFVAQSGTLTVPAGDTATTMVVDVVGDDRMEGDETFTVVLSNPRNAEFVDPEALGTIVDDDVPQLRVTKVDVVLGDTLGTGEAEPGEEVEYVLVVQNIGTGTASASQLVDPVPANTSIVAGSLTTDRGSIAGEDPPVVNLGDLRPGEQATITFRVELDSPFPVDVEFISNQATVTSVELPDLLSDDPDTAEPNDPTVTPVMADDTVRCYDEAFDQDLDDLWHSAFIGDADQGTYEVVNGALRVSGNGSELFHGDDNGHFVYRDVEGDFRTELAFADVPADTGGQYRKACLMVRDGLDPLAARFMACLIPHFPTPDGPTEDVAALQFDHRPVAGEPAIELASTHQDVTLPTHVAFTRRGDTFTVSFSIDGGANWIEQLGGVGGSAEVALPSTLQVGVMVASYDPAQTFTAEVDNLSICSPNPGDPSDPGDPGTCDTDQKYDVVYLFDLSESMTADFADGSGNKLAAAREALRLVHDQIEVRQDGSRAALLTFAGGNDVDANLNGSLAIRENLTANLSAVAEGILDLDSSDVAPLATTPTALGLQGLREQVAPLFDSDSQPVVVWVTDGVPNIDIDGRGPDEYRLDEIQDLSLRDASGNFLSWGQAAWLGHWNAAIRTFDGETMANSMLELERLKAQVPDLLIYGIAIHGNGVELGTYSDDLVDYAAYVSGGQSYQGTDLASLETATSALLGDLLCDASPVGAVGDRVWNDLDGDGEQDAFEPGLSQVGLELLDADGQVMAGVTTNSQGTYLFENVPAGSHTVRVDVSTLPGGLDQATYDADGNATPGIASLVLDPWQVTRELDFGFRATPAFQEDPPATAMCPLDDFEDGVLTGVDSPFPWTVTAIGDASSGGAVEVGGRLELSSNGSAMWTDDNIHFVYHSVSGDFRLEVDVVDVPVDPGGNRFRKAGAMIRKDLDVRSPRVMVQYLPDTGETGPLVQFGFRDTAGGQSFVLSDPVRSVQLPIRLALEKRGNLYSAWYSTDRGESWQQNTAGGAGSSVAGTVELDLGEQPLVGLAAASYDNANELTVAFDDLAVCSPADVAAAAPPVPGVCDDQMPMDVAVVLDLSGSMAADYSGGPSRFEAARLAVYDLRDRLAARGDGSRLALVTYAGSSDPIADQESAVRVLSGLTSDLGSMSAVLDGLRPEDIDPAAGTASPLALQQLEQLLSTGANPAHRPMVVWLTDEQPNVDLLGRGPYSPELPAVGQTLPTFQLTDDIGGYLPWSQVAWQGAFIGDFGRFAGEPVANAMSQLEALRTSVPEVRVFSLALRSDGTVSAPFDEALLEFAAWLTAGEVDGADNTQDLLLAAGNLWQAMTCTQSP